MLSAKSGRVIGVEMTLAIPEATEWQKIGNQLDVPMISANVGGLMVSQDKLAQLSCLVAFRACELARS